MIAPYSRVVPLVIVMLLFSIVILPFRDDETLVNKSAATKASMVLFERRTDPIWCCRVILILPVSLFAAEAGLLKIVLVTESEKLRFIE